MLESILIIIALALYVKLLSWTGEAEKIENIAHKKFGELTIDDVFVLLWFFGFIAAIIYGIISIF